MQTSFSMEFLQTPVGKRANEILRKCVHCGFCNATCPTYQLTGNELDGPRGRIYLIKNSFENDSDHLTSRYHLDRCLTCQACETTCPSGVEYGELLDLGRHHLEKSSQRSLLNSTKRNVIKNVFSRPSLTKWIFSVAKAISPLLPKNFAKKLPTTRKPQAQIIEVTAARKFLTIKGCVQSATAPYINSATKRVLAKAAIQLDESNSNCCGALAYHLGDHAQAKNIIRKNLQEWSQKLKFSHEILLITSSGCSTFIKQYATIMQDDQSYANLAKSVSDQCKDLAEIGSLLNIENRHPAKTIAFHSPCTLQHGQKISGKVESLLTKAGYDVQIPNNAHLCCGSAGSYSLLEPELSTQLLSNKLQDLQESQPDIIATANIGCLLHLQSGTSTPVKHWIELLI